MSEELRNKRRFADGITGASIMLFLIIVIQIITNGGLTFLC